MFSLNCALHFDLKITSHIFFAHFSIENSWLLNLEFFSSKSIHKESSVQKSLFNYSEIPMVSLLLTTFVTRKRAKNICLSFQIRCEQNRYPKTAGQASKYKANFQWIQIKSVKILRILFLCAHFKFSDMKKYGYMKFISSPFASQFSHQILYENVLYIKRNEQCCSWNLSVCIIVFANSAVRSKFFFLFTLR